jgi:hypothetical protein
VGAEAFDALEHGGPAEPGSASRVNDCRIERLARVVVALTKVDADA